MELFKKQRFSEYSSDKYECLKKEIEKLSDEEINNCDIDELKEYYLGKYQIDSIDILEENIERNLDKTKVKKYNIFKSLYEPEYYNVDGVAVTFKIPFFGDNELLECCPSTVILTLFEVCDFIKPNNEQPGSFSICFSYSLEELQNKGEEINNFIQNEFDNCFKNYKLMVQYLNKDIVKYNDDLSLKVIDLLKERKDKADVFKSISKSLNIPMKLNKNSPNIIPIKMKPHIRKLPERPKMKKPTNEYCISDEDYNNINNIIYMCGTTIEQTARSYYRNDEEELRDHLLATLNTHYESATGETFRKIGKTDINIEFENKAAFIGECKIWHGIKKFEDAIQQAINYSTWRDLKISVIIFNKENKSFNTIMENIDKWLKDHSVKHYKDNKNKWNCEYYRQDMEVNIKLTILAFDLYVDKNQFKDSRY